MRPLFTRGGESAPRPLFGGGNGAPQPRPLIQPQPQAAPGAAVFVEHAPDADYALLASAFSDTEQVQLTLAIGAINLWNRLQVGFRAAHPVDRARDAA